MGRFLSTVVRWIVKRLSRIPERDHNYTVWLIFICWIASTTAFIIQAIGNPTGATLFSHVTNIGKAVAVNGFYFLVWTIVISALFSFIYLPLPRLFLGSFSYVIFSSVFILLDENSGTLFSYIVGIGYSLIAMLIGLFFILLFRKKMRGIIAFAAFASILVVSSIYLFFDNVDNKEGTLQAVADHYTNPIQDENPGEIGNYDYTFVTYGSGDDLHREAFEAVDIITPTVDASSFITKWGKKREAFWGFDPSDLPVNGRVWIPEGEGTFPIILMVHGNHTMEYFSTSGYDYLGEQLASRGFITISVDEDFINYSNNSGSPNDNYTLRAWMLLQHLVQLQDLNESPENALYQKVDFDQIALLGHSRGGQAALMAADYASFFDDDRLIESMDAVNIKAVVALAPTDTKVNNKKPHMHNVSYLLLHGARDADVRNFRGDRHFYRSTFDKDDDGFKATLYIADANHTQFNTDWGQMDLSLPKGLFLNQRQTMSPDDQQQIAKVYISAFFESIFHGNSSYEKLFQDYRYGKNWLPDTTLVSKYRNARYQPIIQFKRNEDKTIDSNGVSTVAEGFKEWEITTPKNRLGNDRPVDAVLLEWEKDASYTVTLSDERRTDRLKGSEHIVLTMANVNKEADNDSVPEIQIEFETTNGVAVRLPLNDFMPFPPIISTDYTHFGLSDHIFRDGKYEKSWEPIFQTFDIPIEKITKANQKFEKDKLNKITLHFTSSPGKVLMEEIGAW